MKDIIHIKINNIKAEHKNIHKGYEYYRRLLVPYGYAGQCKINVYEIPPGKSAYPYHYHSQNEEAFFIISGNGLLKTPKGEKNVSAGDFLFFPAEENGAHKLTNTSELEMLIYLDFDTENKLDVAIYPDSGKIGIWGNNIDKVFRINQEVDYFEGE